jgi:hypothetical protein
MKYGNWIVKIAVMVLIAIVLVVFVTMLLWNWLVPELFNGPVINFWQTLGLLALSKIFFWSFAKGHHKGGSHWKPYWKEKWNTMSAEERERFKQKMKDKWCYKAPDTSEGNSDNTTV